MRAIVLAAGFATRLHPLTRDRAKPLLDVCGRPVLSWLCDKIAGVSGLSELAIVGNGRFFPQLEGWRAGYACPLPVHLIDDGTQNNEHRLGGIGDLALALKSRPSDDEGYLVAAGDNLIEFDLQPHAAAFRRHGQTLLLVRAIDGPVPPRRHGEVVVDAQDRIVAFREKPEQPRSPLASLCLYFFPPAVLGWVRDYLAGGGNPDAPGHFLAWLVPRQPVHAARIQVRLFDIGYLEALERARREFRG